MHILCLIQRDYIELDCWFNYRYDYQVVILSKIKYQMYGMVKDV